MVALLIPHFPFSLPRQVHYLGSTLSITHTTSPRHRASRWWTSGEERHSISPLYMIPRESFQLLSSARIAFLSCA